MTNAEAKEIKKEIEGRSFNYFAFQTTLLAVSLEDVLDIIDRKIKEHGNALSAPTCEIVQDNQGNLTAYCPHCHKAIWKTFKQENEDEDC